MKNISLCQAFSKSTCVRTRERSRLSVKRVTNASLKEATSQHTCAYTQVKSPISVKFALEVLPKQALLKHTWAHTLKSNFSVRRVTSVSIRPPSAKNTCTFTRKVTSVKFATGVFQQSIISLDIGVSTLETNLISANFAVSAIRSKEHWNIMCDFTPVRIHVTSATRVRSAS